MNQHSITPLKNHFLFAEGDQLSRTRDAFLRETLLAELRELHNLIGRPMPAITLLGTAAKQLPLTLA